MNLNLALKRIKWGLKGIKEYGLKDFRAIGLYYINYTETSNATFSASGWAYSFLPLIEKPHLELLDGNSIIFQQSLTFDKSTDAASYFHYSDDPEADFYIYLEYRSNKELQVRIVFKTEKGDYYLSLGSLKANRKEYGKIEVSDPWITNQLGRVELGFSQLNTRPNYDCQSDLFADLIVDIIIPVYNGYEFLPRLFETIDKTKVKHNVFIINDSSTDPRVKEIIEEYLHNNSHTVVVNNETNLGFLGSANKGLELSTNHAVIVNTDVELPDQWLERIIKPIIEDNSIASATPFTNSGTICSFPVFLEDNDIPNNMTVDEIDSFFKSMVPIYTEIPTGVGFCMAMNRKTLNEIGSFDGNAFGRGYGEENDWCQRAIKYGYKNVMVEDLFVYHKHGGSFDSQEKIGLYKQHESILAERYPEYFADVARYCENDPLSQFRNYLYARIRASKIAHPILIFNHLLGGGATDYLNKRIQKLSEQRREYALISYSPETSIYHIQIFDNVLIFQFESSSLNALLSVFDDPAELWINELATYPHLTQTLETISNYITEKNLDAKLFLHDYFCLCPSINLLSEKGHYCGLPSTPMVCEKCYEDQEFNVGGFGESIQIYRDQWNQLLKKCSKVICFSTSSENLFHKIYPDIATSLIPHEVTPLSPINASNYKHEGINIGFLGNMTKHKGASIIYDIARISPNNSTRFVVIGRCLEEPEYNNISIIGEYDHNSLHKIISEEEIDILFIPSIWPETFSFTTSEAISTDLPVAVFDIGAPAERVSDYSKGLVIPLDTKPEEILTMLITHANQTK